MIQFHEESKTFHLYNDQISYIFKTSSNPSSTIDLQTIFAFSFKTLQAFPMATPTRQNSIISKSFSPSPKAYVSS